MKRYNIYNHDNDNDAYYGDGWNDGLNDAFMLIEKYGKDRVVEMLDKKEIRNCGSFIVRKFKGEEINCFSCQDCTNYVDLLRDSRINPLSGSLVCLDECIHSNDKSWKKFKEIVN